MGSRSKHLVEGAVKQMLVWGHKLRLLDEAGSWGTSTRKGGQSALAESIQGLFSRSSAKDPFNQGKTKGQQLKGKIVS